MTYNVFGEDVKPCSIYQFFRPFYPTFPPYSLLLRVNKHGRHWCVFSFSLSEREACFNRHHHHHHHQHCCDVIAAETGHMARQIVITNYLLLVHYSRPPVRRQQMTIPLSHLSAVLCPSLVKITCTERRK